MADELDPQARELLAAYRRDAGPSPAATERLLAAVRRSAAATEAAQVLPLRRRIDSRHWVGVAVVGLVAAAVALAIKISPRRLDADAGAAGSAAALHAADGSSGASVTPRSRPGAPAEATTAEATTASVAPEPAPPTEPPLQRPTARESTGSQRRDPRVGETREAGTIPPSLAPAGDPAPGERQAAPANAPAVHGEGDALVHELAAMRAINDSLAAGATAQALARIDEYEGRFPAGALREEAAALRAVALCAGGREREGAAAATEFLRAHPGSLSAERVRKACGAP
ncbi:hypothetical protein [Nannocystis pusilla]|uniref:Outer membrane lipoprotein BamD-like domain-containing protein n=1 Tax=Nannocystis pusilla TaxID=889268 RepID=A0ABS7U5I5_9BACT|nr:hypothetical protein [Nannocystis pusilla]MBZ5715815.1 hypothetical protein [Nannocystis pusilla]